MEDRTSQIAKMALRVGLLLLLPVAARSQTGASAAASSQIELRVSLRQPFVAEPEAARLVLHIRNLTSQTLWLYRRAQAKRPPVQRIQEEYQPVETTGTSTVEVTLQPADTQAAQAVSSRAAGTTLEYVQMPKPRLIRLAAGGDYQEVAIVHLRPALAAGQKPIWGAYRVAVVYTAHYSNGDEFLRNLGANLWQGEVTSNAITIDLRPPLPDSVGVASGTALGGDLQPRAGVRVSLQDEQGLLLDQQVTGPDGRFSFANLPLALYWVTGRREEAREDTVTYRHVELTRAAPRADAQLVFYAPEIYDAAKLVHKPVLVRAFDPGGRPLSGVAVDATYSNGQVVDDVKAVTGDDGFAVMSLLPGRSSVSLTRAGCDEQVERIDVAPGVGVDNFKTVFNCAKK